MADGSLPASADLEKSITVAGIAALARQFTDLGMDIIDLSMGQPTFLSPPHVRQAGNEARSGINRYTNEDGMPDLKAAIGGKFERENGLFYDPETQITVGAGATGVIDNAMRATIKPAAYGDLKNQVIIPAPYWDLYPKTVKLAGGAPHFVQTRSSNGFKLTPGDLEENINEHTKWLFLNSPNNPSGAIYTETELVDLARVLKRHPHVRVLSDEIYEHFAYGNRRHVSIASVDNGSLYDRTLTVNGPSKAYSMTGARIGYGGGPSVLIEEMREIQAVAQICPVFTSQVETMAALKGPQDFLPAQRRMIQTRLKEGATILREAGLECTMPQGAFYLWVNCREAAESHLSSYWANDRDIVSFFLSAANVAVGPGRPFGEPHYMRLSGAHARLKEGCRRIAGALRQHRPESAPAGTK